MHLRESPTIHPRIPGQIPIVCYASRKPRLVVVSNRGPFRREGARWVRSAGGLVAALHPVLLARGGVWSPLRVVAAARAVYDWSA